MTAEEFVLKLIETTPTREHLLNCGYPESVVKRLITGYKVVRRKEQSIFQDELLRLIDMYDTSQFDIWDITFNPDVEESDEYWYAGWIGGDLIAVHKNSGIIQNIESGTDNYIMCSCAVNGMKFLDAVACVLEYDYTCYVAGHMINVDSDQNILCNLAIQFAEKAGGLQYSTFAKSIFSCFN